MTTGAGGAAYTFTVDGQVATCVYPNNTKVTYGYNQAGRLTTLTHTIGSTGVLLVGYAAQYDAGGRITQITETPSGDVTQFTYDGANNLLSETRTGTKPYSGAYTYDRSNRRKTARVITNGITTHNGAYSYDGAGRLSQVVDSATGLTEVYTWNPDGTMASSPGPAGSGYSLLFGYDEEQHLTSLQHNTGGTITTAYQYGYAADGGRRWRKDLANNLWTWYPCGVACNAGELVEQTSDLTGNVWTTSALYLRVGNGCSSKIIRRNNEYHHVDMLGVYALISNSTASIVSNALYDAFGLQRFSSGTAVTPWRYGSVADEQMLHIRTGTKLPARDLISDPLEPIYIIGCLICIIDWTPVVKGAFRDCSKRYGPPFSSQWYACLRRYYKIYKAECEKNWWCRLALEACKEACKDAIPMPIPQPIPDPVQLA